MTPTTTSRAPRSGWDPRHYEALIDVLVARIDRAESKPELVVRHSLPLPPAPPIYPVPSLCTPLRGMSMVVHAPALRPHRRRHLRLTPFCSMPYSCSPPGRRTQPSLFWRLPDGVPCEP